MKKLLSAVMACSLLFGVAGCKKTETAATGAFKAGTYTAVGEGKNGEIKVEVTFSSDAITEVKVVDHAETPNIADGAIAQIPEKIVADQTLAVDAVAGATYTSNGILDAVKDAVQQAGGNVDSLMKVDTEKEVEEIALSTDVVVIGGGAAGMSAAVRLDEKGKNVILLEKSSFLGGALSVSGGNQVVMGSKLQETAGVTDDSVASMVEDFKKNGADKNNEEMLTLFAQNVGETTDWFHEYVGVNYDMEGGLHQLGEYSHNRELAYEGGGAGGAQAMKDFIETKENIQVYLSTCANELIVEDGVITGVKAVSLDGTKEYTITAGNVVLATGGYGNNDDLLTEELQSSLYYGPASSTGDGILMATVKGIDAQTANMEYGKRYPNGIEVEEGMAKSTIAGNIVAWTMSAILVNAEGERVVNEKSSNRNILETEIEQTNSMLYLLLDEETFNVWKTKLASAGISDQDIEKYLAANGSTTPVFAHGETLEEVAGVVGMDAETLKKTVETYNSYVDSGVDADFGRSADYMTMKIGNGPYNLIEQKPRFATTMGGLVINGDMQVLNTSGEVISGLYAAGEVTGQVMGDDSPSGANNAWALTSGKMAADSICK